MRGAAEDVAVMRIERSDFLENYWDYNAGEHVTVLAPSGGGKTHLAYELLENSMSEELPAIIFVMKPRDKTVASFSRKYKLRTVRQWPPPTSERVMHGKSRGWVLWPRFTFDPKVDEQRQEVIFRAATLDSYRKGNRILFADETYSLENEMDLGTELRTVWTKGRSMECGLFAASQRPAYISRWAYQAHHLFIGNDTDDDARRRLAEIGAAVDKQLVRRTVAGLGKWEFLYINRDERSLAVITR